MVKAKAAITISKIIDIEKTVRYYLLQSSTSSAPSKPTANPPGGSWSTTEPSYTTGSTNTLYFVDLTIMSDDSFSYSAVSKSSSYEAAKAAYNKATNVENTMTEFKQTSEGWQMNWDKILNGKEANINKHTDYITFKDGNIKLGDSASTKTLEIGNEDIKIRNGKTPVASFGEEVMLGYDGNTRVVISSNGLELYADAIHKIMRICYDKHVNEDGSAEYTPHYVFGVANSTASCAIAEGNNTEASGSASHAEGVGGKAAGFGSHAEGHYTKASGAYSHAEGKDTEASGSGSHAEGNNTMAAGYYSHAEGDEAKVILKASGGPPFGAHVEGQTTIASNDGAHAEGYKTEASGSGSHAEGRNTKASGVASHSGGFYTIASKDYQTAIGKYNAERDDALFLVGNGTAEDKRSNILSVYSDHMNVGGAIGAFGDLNVSGNLNISGNAIISGTLGIPGFGEDGNVKHYIDNLNQNVWQSLQIAYRTNYGQQYNTSIPLLINGNSLGMANAQLIIEYGGSYIRFRNDGNAFYIMNGDGNSWTNFIAFFKDGTVHMPNTLRVNTRLCLPYATNAQTTSAANAYISADGNGNVAKTSKTSSRRFKDSITPELDDDLNPEHLYDVDVIQFKYKEDYFTNEDDIRYRKNMIGLIAEDVYDKYKIAADWHVESGEVLVDGWNEQYIIPALLKLIQNQHKELQEQRTEIDQLKETVDILMKDYKERQSK